jgi:hypothetical protein
MAYGVKYRLDFSDNESNKKRIDIAKNGYVGSVINAVGTGNPIVITYQQDDDVYSPIIGSSAKINLYVTDDVSYDDLYTEDEREFKVTLYFWDNTYGGYVVYWQGFIIPDAFQEVITSKPYAFTISASDQLGVLDGYNHGLRSAIYDIKTIIEHCIDYTDLGLNYDYDIMLGLEGSTADYNDAFVFTKIYSDAYFDKGSPMDCKAVLESILGHFNMRIYQRRGYYNGVSVVANKWIIQSNGTTLDTTYQTSYNMPSDLLPISNNLIRTKKGSLKELVMTADVKKQVNPVRNGYFENGDLTSGHWTSASGFIGGYSNKGLYSYYFSEKVNAGTYTEQLRQIQMMPYIAQNTEFTFSFDYNFNNGNFSTFPATEAEYAIPFVIRVRLGSTSTYWYYKESDDTWQNTLTYNQAVYKGRGEWKTYSKTITTPTDIGNGETSGNANTLEVYFYRPYLQSGGTHFYTYLDGINIEINRWNAEFGVNGEQTFEYIYTDEISTNTSTGNKSRKETYSGIYQNSLDNKYIAGKLINDGNNDVAAKFLRSASDTAQYIDEITNQQRINDARNGLIRYEGTVKKIDDETPLCIGDYFSVTFTGLTETNNVLIDTINYNVKSNLYDITGHIQDQAIDSTTTTIRNYK